MPFLNPRMLLAQYGYRAKKGLGQHFLVDAGHLERIIAAADLSAADVVLEVGPGLGVLTEALAQQAKQVVAVELDEAMQQVLADRLGHYANLTVLGADILAVDPAALVLPFLAGGSAESAAARRKVPDSPSDRPDREVLLPPWPPVLAGYKVVANLPYYITSAVLRHLLEASIRPECMVVMVQWEVAQRILAEPGDMSVLAVAVQLYARPSLVSRVPAGAFYPPPKVDSAVMRLDVFDAPPVDVGDIERFFRVVRAGFGQKRKQLKNSLAGGLGITSIEAEALLGAAGIESRRRAEELSLAEWSRLATRPAVE